MHWSVSNSVGHLVCSRSKDSRVIVGVIVHIEVIGHGGGVYQNLTSNMSKFNNWVILCKSYILPNYTFCYLFIYKFVNEQLFDSKTYFFLPISLPNLLKFLLRKVVWLLVSAGYFFLIFCGLYHFCEVFKFLEKMGHFVHFLFKTWTWSNKLIKLKRIKNKEF